MEISGLKSENVMLKAKMDEQQKMISRLSIETDGSGVTGGSFLNRTATNLDDEKALEIIELTLLKYQNFLDFLRNAGLGKLIELGEIHQQRQQEQHRQKQKPNTKHTQTTSRRGESKEDYELAYLAAKLIMQTSGREDNDSITTNDLMSLASASLSMHETSIDSMANFDADGNFFF